MQQPLVFEEFLRHVKQIEQGDLKTLHLIGSSLVFEMNLYKEKLRLY